MAIDNQFRINELIVSGSRAIISKDSISGTHTFVQGSKQIVLGKSEGGDAPYTHIKGERDGEFVGRVEKPKYDEEQLKKAIDVEVDELISPPPKPKPDVVPRKLYEDLRKQYRNQVSLNSELQSIITELRADIASLQAEIEALRIQVDVAKQQQAAAENEAQITNEKYQGLLQDFSNSVIKGTREGIERVSLTAQVEGLQAQKESLRQLLSTTQRQLQAQRDAFQIQSDAQQRSFDQQTEALRNVLQQQSASFEIQSEAQRTAAELQRDILEAQAEAQREAAEITQQLLQQQIDAANQRAEETQEQLDNENAEQASQSTATGKPGTFDVGERSGWKLPQSEMRRDDRVLFIKTSRDKKVDLVQGTAINFYNFDDKVSQTFNIQLDAEASKWLRAPRSITIPPRVGDKAGVGHINLQWVNKTDDTRGKRNTTFEGAVTVTTSLGESHVIRASYERQVDRKDTWGTRGSVGTVVGREKL